MSKKLYAAFVPLLAVAGFAIAPATASAVTTYGTCAGAGTSANCPGGTGPGKFTAFPGLPTRTQVEGRKVSSVFTLQTESGSGGFTCKQFSSIGWMWNTSGVGRSNEAVSFEECHGFGEFAGCKSTIEGGLTGKVLIETGVEAVVEAVVETGFQIECNGNLIGLMIGHLTGTQTAKTAVLKFNHAPGLNFEGRGWNITGEAETSVIVNGKQVFI